MSTGARNTSIEAKVDALMKKLGVSLDTSDAEESVESRPSEKEQPLPAMPKIDLPRFDGSDALSWLTDEEQHFLVHYIPVDQRVQIALIVMSRPTMSWIQILLRRCPKMTWSQFSNQLLAHFGDRSMVNGYEAFFTTKQTGSLEDYVSASEGRVSQLTELTDELYFGAFLAGLKMEIQVLIQDAALVDCSAKILMAKKIAQASSVPRPPHRIRNMTDEEYRKHLAAFTCFRCGLEFSATHCDPYEDANDDGHIFANAHLTVEVQPKQQDLASFCNVESTSIGFDGPQTMKLISSIGEPHLKVMIYSGASHCFVMEHVAKELHWANEHTARFLVVLGDRTLVYNGGILLI
ncbi:hypothetical protein OROMI_005192 [Orobanche minor]